MPVFDSHSESVNVEFEKDFELDELKIRSTNRGRTDAEVEEIMQMKPYEAILFEEEQREEKND